MIADNDEILLLPVNRVAELLSASERHIWRQADAGRMPKPVKFGRLKRWVREELEEWIAGGCKPVRMKGSN